MFVRLLKFLVLWLIHLIGVGAGCTDKGKWGRRGKSGGALELIDGWGLGGI